METRNRTGIKLKAGLAIVALIVCAGTCGAQTLSVDGGPSVSPAELVMQMRSRPRARLTTVAAKPIPQETLTSEDGSWYTRTVVDIYRNGPEAVKKLTPEEKRTLIEKLQSDIGQLKSGKFRHDAIEELKRQIEQHRKDGDLDDDEAKEAFAQGQAQIDEFASKMQLMLEQVLSYLKEGR